MAKHTINLEGGDVTVEDAVHGDGVALKRVADGADGASTTVTCTCYSGGQAYSQTVTCARDGWCDCTNPTSPQVRCT